MNPQRYSSVAIVLHWAIAVLLLFNIWLGWRYAGDESALGWLMAIPGLGTAFEGVPARGFDKFTVLQLHKSVGITVLLLSLARLGWRLMKKPPAFSSHVTPFEKALAKTVHWGFYIAILALPLSGWVMVSASATNLPTVLYGSIPWPHLGWVHGMSDVARKSAEETSGQVHHLLVNITYLLVFLHVAGALKHQILDRDGTLGRMAPLPFLRARSIRE